MLAHPSAMRRSRRLFSGAVILVLLAGALLGWWRVRQEDQRLRAELMQQATLISWALNANEVASLTASARDLDRYLYQRIKHQLVQTRALYPLCRFLYLMKREANGTIVFLADSEPLDSIHHSPPGQTYDEATPLLHQALSEGTRQVEGPIPDRWGTWVSALVPLYHPHDDRVVALLGMDVDAREWRTHILRPLYSTGLFMLLLLMVLGLGYLLFRQAPAAAARGPAWRSPEVLFTVMAGLTLTIITAYLAHETERHAHRESFQRKAVAQASLVQQAMFRIGDNYLEGLARFFGASEFVDRQEFIDYVGYLLQRPYAKLWAWIPVVTDAERTNFEAAVRQGGASDFLIREQGPDGAMRVADQRPLYYPVCYIEPEAENRTALGYDQGSEPVRRAALEEAARTGLITATDPLGLIPQPDRSTDILIYRPVYDQVEATRLVGFCAVALRTDSFLRRALSRESTRNESVNRIRLYQVRSPELIQWLASNEDLLPRPISFPTTSLFHLTEEVPLVVPVFAFGKVYALVNQPSSYFFTLYPDRAVARTSWAGLLLTTLATLLAGVLTSRRTALERTVMERTAELRQSENSYHGLFNAIQQAIYILDERGTFIDVNDGAVNMYGYPREELIGRNPASVSAPNRNNMTETALHLEKARQGEPQYFEFWGQRKNGEVFPKDVWLYPGVYFGRAVVVAVAADITDRKRSEQELRDTHERLNTFIRAIPDTVQIKDGQGRWLIINEAAARLFQVEHYPWHGCTEAELAESRPAFRALHESCEMSDEAAWRSPGLSIYTEVVRNEEGQQRIFEVRKLPLFEPDGQRKALITIGRDVTERKQAEEEKERLQAQLQQAQKMESVGRLAGGVAHDFNNMLQAILGNASLALEESPAGPLSEYLQEIKRSAQRSADLTRQLLAFASRQTVNPRVIDLNDTISGMLKMLRRLIGEDIQLLWAPGSDLWPVKVDPSQIDQILANLAVNARDAIGGVGTVTIETSNFTYGTLDRQNYPGGRPGDYVMLTVRDTGQGMDEETRNHIFEPFYTTKGPGKGVGLGLATVFGIVKQNHGFIAVQSEPGLGATFKIGLPRTLLAPTPETAGGSAQPARGHHEAVLLVEDELPVLRFGKDSLKRLGYHVLVAHTPEEALEVARHAGPTLKLLITDVVLPTMNGRELAQRLTQMIPGLKCLFMSGYTADIIAHRGVLDEQVHFLQKPFSLEALATKVRAILDEPPAAP